MHGQAMWLHALTPMHTGIGQSVAVIDLPVAREKTTGWPYLPGSSVKGVLRDACTTNGGPDAQVAELFGPDTEKASEGAGSLLFCDARLLCLPVRSYAGAFAWVTCPAVWNRLQRDLRAAGQPELPDLAASPDYEHCVAAPDSAVAHNGKVILEDLDIAVQGNGAGEAARAVAARVFGDQPSQDAFVKRFLVVHDDLFSFLTETATEVTARIKIDSELKVVDKKHGGLWYEEAVPAESLFWSMVLAAPRNGQDGAGLLAALRQRLGEAPLLQFGGHASVGRGLTRVIL